MLAPFRYRAYKITIAGRTRVLIGKATIGYLAGLPADTEVPDSGEAGGLQWERIPGGLTPEEFAARICPGPARG